MPLGAGGVPVAEKGLVFDGIVTRVDSATSFRCPGLSGFDNAFFQGWAVYVVRKVDGTGAAPQGEGPACLTYVSLTGAFTHVAFTAPLMVGDEIYLIHPNFSALAASILALMADVGDASASVLGSIFNILGNPALSVSAQLAIILAAIAVSAPDAVTNLLMRDVTGNKASTAIYTPDAVSDLTRYAKGEMNLKVRLTGTAAAGSTAAQLVNAGLNQADNFWQHATILMLTGANAGLKRAVYTSSQAATSVTFDAVFPNAIGVGDVFVLTTEYAAQNFLAAIRGGASTIQGLQDDLNTFLDLAWSPQSGSLLMTGAEQQIYLETGGGLPFKFDGGYIDLSMLLAGDTVLVKVYAIIDATNYRKLTIDAVNTYNGPMADPAAIVIDELPPTLYGIRVTLQQTAGVMRTIFFGFADEKRGT